MMKKLVVPMVLCFFIFNFIGCNSEDYNEIYSDDSKIASNNDDYFAVNLLSNDYSSSGEFAITGTMTGAETIWRYDADDDMDADVTYSLSISKGGKVKLVLISPDEEVSIIEEIEDTNVDIESMTKTISLKKGRNRMKVVAYDSAKFALKAKMDVGYFGCDE